MTCCQNPNITTPHAEIYAINDAGRYEAIPFINRLCLNCLTHWYGPPDALVTYSRREWDAYVNRGAA
jgi:hypothetical protein